MKKIILVLALVLAACTPTRNVDQGLFRAETTLDSLTTSFDQCIADPTCPMTTPVHDKLQAKLQEAHDLAAAAHGAFGTGDLSTAQAKLNALQSVLNTIKSLIPVKKQTKVLPPPKNTEVAWH